MRVTAKLLLPQNVVVAPIANLPSELSSRFDHEAEDYYVTDIHDRQEFIIVDAQTAALLEHFRAPCTVIDAVVAFCRANKLDPERTLDDAFSALSDLVAARVLMAESALAHSITTSLSLGTSVDGGAVPEAAHLLDDSDGYGGRASAAPGQTPSSTLKNWQVYRYYEIYRNQFSVDECRTIVSLQSSHDLISSKMKYQSGDSIRDCSLFWISRNRETDWIFARLWKLGQQFNKQYDFEISPDMRMAQLTRYTVGQQFNWHMDLGAKDASLRKITIVLQLSSNKDIHGGGTEIFFGESIDNKVHADIGDVVVFPSFVMHRGAIVDSGVRWSLVVWLTGSKPFR